MSQLNIRVINKVLKRHLDVSGGELQHPLALLNLYFYVWSILNPIGATLLRFW